MQFRSVNTGDYSQSAKAVTKNMDSIYSTARQTAPDFEEISKTAMNVRRSKEQALIKAKNLTDRTKLKQEGYNKQTEILADSIDDARAITRPAKRFAGIVAATGALSSAYIQKKEMDRDAADRAELKQLRLAQEERMEELHNSQMELNRTQIEGQEGEIADLKSRLKKQEEELKGLQNGNSPKPASTVPTSGALNTNTEGNTINITPPKTSVSDNLSFDLTKLTRKDYEDLAFAVSGEAGPGNDKYGVAASILNRVAHNRFPNTVSEVIHAPGQYQAVYEGNSRYQPDVADEFMSPQGQAQLKAAFKVLDGRTDFKGQTQLHNRSNKGNKDYDGDGIPDMDPMFHPLGNFFHRYDQ